MFRMLQRLSLATMALIVGLAVVCGHSVYAHEGSVKAARTRQSNDRKILLAQARKDGIAKTELGVCKLSLELIDAQTGQRLAGNVKLTHTSSGESVALSELVPRPNQWFSMDGNATVEVPQAELDVSAFHGIETPVTSKRIQLLGKAEFNVRLELSRFYRVSDHGLVAGNTHLHLNRISRAESDRYLRVVPAADAVDVLYVSHLRRVMDDETYITNEYNAESLAALSSPQVALHYGEEHRHNFDKYGEGYGHVMFLDIRELVEPVSLGPGLTGEGTDGVPLWRGITKAQQTGASVIWCHNTFGFEDLPNFMNGSVQVLNIFDGGDHGSYKDSYYRYLDLGLHVPFSTGTDWFMYDLSRVHVRLDGDKSSRTWLSELSKGNSHITNGTFLELRAGDARIGDTVRLEKPGTVNVVGRGIGRDDFRAIELIQNGEIVSVANSRDRDGHFEALLEWTLPVNEPGWIALRVALDTNKNQFSQTLFAHTSPIYIELAGRRIFRRETAHEMMLEMERSISIVKSEGVFASDTERQAVLKVHREGIAALQKRMRDAGN